LNKTITESRHQELTEEKVDDITVRIKYFPRKALMILQRRPGLKV
jgi:hypothetical protein